MTLDDFFGDDGAIVMDDDLGPVTNAGWPERAGREGDTQPMPITHSDRPDIQSLVIEDIGARREIGIKRYGTALQADNGRDAVRDAYEEALDLATYLRQVLEEDLHGRLDWLVLYSEALEQIVRDASPIHHRLLIEAAAEVANRKYQERDGG